MDGSEAFRYRNPVGRMNHEEIEASRIKKAKSAALLSMAQWFRTKCEDQRIPADLVATILENKAREVEG